MKKIEHLSHFPAVDKLTLRNIFDTFFPTFIESNAFSEATKRNYGNSLKSFIKWCEENRVDMPTKYDLECYKGELEQRCMPATIHASIAGIKSFFEWLEYVEVIRENPFRNFRNVKLREYDSITREALSLEEISKMLEIGSDPSTIALRDRAIFASCLNLGLRTIEVERANIEDLKIVGGQCRLYIRGKGRKTTAEYLKVPCQLERILMDYLSTRESPAPEEPLFLSYCHRNQGITRIKARSVSGIIKKKLRDIGIDDKRYTAHSLRSTMCTVLLQANNGNVQEAQAQMRHQNPKTTMKYARNLDMSKSKSSAQVANMIF